ncbi:SUMF1/EgtB/PvdO family nonheme iron enzyme [Natronoflexus pectinivorans]|uniref:Formylglycine-generating enzyme required for sulfatase activity n=1 Tax=Natronoflexus pectinivorans TaxID=682526 RepID=A0A4R2GD60_9BACT|nr:SUMF1/EgtB/PvdO family nonheme iron enzyme [Natronoflexus pectinivorans]TCO05987.1 formylglycine-generating enzyme required for sulfatase activity [Natronoflexus pectinivorans]
MKPKAFYFLIWLITVSLSYYSCSKSEKEMIPDEKEDSKDKDKDGDDTGDPDHTSSIVVNIYGSDNIDASEIQMTYKKDACLIIIKSDVPYTITNNSEWLSLADYSGEAGAKGIVVGVSKNESIPRNSQISIQAGSNQHTIHVNQQGAPVIRFSAGDIEFRMVLVEGGSFMMGDSDIPESRWAHSVSVNSFYMCETEVTNGLWSQIMGSLPYDDLEGYDDHNEYNRPNHPVSAVSWNEINDHFLPAISDLTGFEMRLPTEAEWEFAAMGGNLSKGYAYAGSNTLNDVAWNTYNSANSKQPVAQLLPNELGLYDMSGNVSEWCSDWYKSGYNSSDNNNPTGPETGTEKVIRGGDYSDMVMFGHGAFYVKARWYATPGCFSKCWGDTGHPDEPICFRCHRVGFRFVMSF